jgi:hypothetical protein
MNVGAERIARQSHRRMGGLLLSLGGVIGLAAMLPYIGSLFSGPAWMSSLPYALVLLLGVFAVKNPSRARFLGLAAVAPALVGGLLALVILYGSLTWQSAVGIFSGTAAFLGTIFAFLGTLVARTATSPEGKG